MTAPPIAAVVNRGRSSCQPTRSRSDQRPRRRNCSGAGALPVRTGAGGVVGQRHRERMYLDAARGCSNWSGDRLEQGVRSGRLVGRQDGTLRGRP